MAVDMDMDRLRGRVQAAGAWWRQVAGELAILPDTLAKLREGAEDFQRVGRRLLEATEGLEQITKLQAGTLKAVRDQLGGQVAGAVGNVGNPLADINEALNRLARLNPFWPRTSEREGGED